MKKKLLISLLVIIPFLTACGSSSGKSSNDSANSTVRCEYKEEGGSLEGLILAIDKGDKLVGISAFESLILDKYDFTSEYAVCKSKEECLEKADTFKEECTKDDDYENCRVESSDKAITVIGDYTSKYLDKQEDYYVGMTKEDAKKQADKDGLTCE